MKEKLVSAWVIPLIILALIVCEIFVWLFLGPLIALNVALIASQIAIGILALWLAQRQKRHSAQIENHVAQHDVRTQRAKNDIENTMEQLHHSVTDLESRLKSANEQIREGLNLSTSEIRRLAQLPSTLKAHPTELRVLDEIAELRTAITAMYRQLSNLRDERQGPHNQNKVVPETGHTPPD